MRRQAYEYQGLMASTWDLLRDDTSRWADRFFYRAIIAEHGQPVLDVGCGTGRLLLDYMQQGIAIDGVDNSPEMLDLCFDKAQRMGLKPNLFQQAMESLDLPRIYRTILVPSSSFQLLTDTRMATEAMRRLYAHLQVGGVLVMPFMVIWREGDPAETDWVLAAEKVRPEDGAVVRRWSRARYDVANRLEHTEDRYEIIRDGAVVAAEHHRRSPATRGYTQDEVVRLYREAGFSDLRLYREFSREPASADDRLFTAVGTKP
jgi:ubiquinone/menaquinone biosynthesis C-methylase UbiE